MNYVAPSSHFNVVIVFRGGPLFDLRGGPLLVFLRRLLALDLSLFCLSLFGHVIVPLISF